MTVITVTVISFTPVTVNPFGKAFAHVVGKTSFLNFYTKLAESSFLCRFRVESVNIFVCAMCFSFRKQFRTCANALPNGFTVTGVKLMTVTVITVIAHGTNKNIDGFYTKTTQKGGFSKLCVKIKKRSYTDLLHVSTRDVFPSF
jgi:hypothetical protein